MAPNDPALVAFIHDNIPSTDPDDDWARSELGLVRVIEDLIEVLIDKKVVMFANFPEGAQKKLLARRGLRKEFDMVEDLFGGDGEEPFEVGDGGLL